MHSHQGWDYDYGYGSCVSTVKLWTPFEPKFTSIWYDSVVFSMTPTRRDSELVTVANGVSTVELWTPLNLRLRLSGTILLYSHRRESHWLLSLAVFLLLNFGHRLDFNPFTPELV